MADIGIRKTHDNLKNKLANYIKAQYFAENDILMKASEEILSKQNVIFQKPYVEVARSYKQSYKGFTEANLDKKYKKIFEELIENKL